MDEHANWQREQLLAQAATALARNGMPAQVFADRQSALDHLIEAAGPAQTIGFGGSMTLAELGLAEMLAVAGKTVLDHSRPGLGREERRAVMQRQLSCDLFFTSTNALTLNGQLVNIDATGNRVGAMVFGPQRVIVVAGANKLTVDLDGALRRIKTWACPPNARRLGFQTPCAETGACSDCRSPQRICRVTTIIDRAPRATELSVCLINEDLGY